jgi:exosome complex component CSL4
MIRIRKNKTTRKKLTGPSEGKPVIEIGVQMVSENKDHFKGQPRDQFRSYTRNQPKGSARDQSRYQFKNQSRDQSKGRFKGDQGKTRRLPYPKKVSWEMTNMLDFRVPHVEETPDKNLEKGCFVLPGEFVGSTEEFKPGNGTVVSAGNVYSTATGNVIIDRKARIVYVKPNTLTPNILKVGDIVYGKIIEVRESGVAVEIAGIEGKEDREIVNSRLGDIHVSNVRDSYVKRLSDEFRPSDIIRAKILDTDRVRLTTSEDSLGVVKAYCSNCRGEIVLEGKKLKCPDCNITKICKISTEYGKGIQ